MKPRISSNVRTFCTILSAILVAAVVIAVFKNCAQQSSDWEATKTRLISALRTTKQDIDTIVAIPLSSMSLDELKELKPKVETLQKVREETYSALVALLERKPFFALNAEETQLLREAKNAIGEPIEAAPTPSIPTSKFVVVTYPTEFYKPDGSSLPILQGTRLKVISRPEWSVLIVEYQGRTYSMQAAFTQPSE